MGSDNTLLFESLTRIMRDYDDTNAHKYTLFIKN